MTRWNENDDPEVWAQRMAYVRAQALKRDQGSITADKINAKDVNPELIRTNTLLKGDLDNTEDDE